MNAPQQKHHVHLPKRVVVAIDAGTLSDFAIDMGAELARLFGAEVELVHALATGMMGTESPVDARRVADGTDVASSVERILLAHAREVLAASKSTLRAENALLVKPGHPARVLIDRARETKADLLVLGALRQRPVMDFGSTARAILAKAPCPVLVQPVPRSAIRSILVPFDMSTEGRLALATACAWAGPTKARVRVMHCFDTSAAMPGAMLAGIAVVGAIDELAKRSRAEFERHVAEFAWGDVEHEQVFVEGLPVAQILAEATSADLIVMGTHGRTGFAAALLGSVAYAVLKHAPKPVLVVRDPERVFQV